MTKFTDIIDKNKQTYSESLLSLPSFYISKNQFYMELLFNILNLPNAKVAEKAWKLLNRLPTSP